MFESLDYVMGLIKDTDRVLDIGGWAEVFPRANVVLDINPYATRKVVHPGHTEHFTRDSWFIGDICTDAVWERFADKEFDFAICSHTLEDIRDPLFVCSQLIRVAKAGYLEMPSAFRETCKMDPFDLGAGYPHHRWIVDVDDSGRLAFTAKLAWANDFDPGGERARAALLDPRFGFLALTWDGDFSYYERMPKGPVLETENLFHYYDTFDYRHPPAHRQTLARPSGDRSTFLWVDEYLLPVEKATTHQVLIARYEERLRHAGRPALRPTKAGTSLLGWIKRALKKVTALKG